MGSDVKEKAMRLYCDSLRRATSGSDVYAIATAVRGLLCSLAAGDQVVALSCIIEGTAEVFVEYVPKLFWAKGVASLSPDTDEDTVCQLLPLRIAETAVYYDCLGEFRKGLLAAIRAKHKAHSSGRPTGEAAEAAAVILHAVYSASGEFRRPDEYAIYWAWQQWENHDRAGPKPRECGWRLEEPEDVESGCTDVKRSVRPLLRWVCGFVA